MHSVIVLNSDDTFLRNIGIGRAWQLLESNKAMPYHPNVKVFIFRTVTSIIKIPYVIRLINYVRRKFRGHVDCRKKHIFIRDSYTCCYCGKKLDINECTIDHVIPRHSGGNNSWENLVTSCSICNSQKRNRTPSQAGMKMLFKPYQPTIMEFMLKRIELDGVYEFIKTLIEDNSDINDYTN